MVFCSSGTATAMTGMEAEICTFAIALPKSEGSAVAGLHDHAASLSADLMILCTATSTAVPAVVDVTAEVHAPAIAAKLIVEAGCITTFAVNIDTASACEN